MKEKVILKILKDFKSDKISDNEAVIKITNVFNPVIDDKHYCRCKKPWGVSHNGTIYCTICENPIKLN